MAVVGKLKDLPAGKMMKVKSGNEEICIANVGGRLFAFAHKCTHMGGLLSKGKLEGNAVICPLHGAKFDVVTGICISGPMGGPPVKDLMIYKVKVAGEDIIVEK